MTGTVASIPLITASIMSKKLAAGIDALVLDVKVGKGAFMKTISDAQELARNMVQVGSRMGKGMAAFITDMNQPLGRSAGNAVEVSEAVAALSGSGPEDLMEVTMAVAARMLLLGGKASDNVSALRLLREKLDSGQALEKFRTMVTLQGGDPAVVDDPSRLPTARIVRAFPAPRAGYVALADAESIGRACLLLGAGRTSVEDSVDPAVGVTDLRKVGEYVEKGEALLTIHANDEQRLAEAEKVLNDAFQIQDEPPTAPQLIHEMILPEKETR